MNPDVTPYGKSLDCSVSSKRKKKIQKRYIVLQEVGEKSFLREN
jgi:hypothetical protein